MPLPKRKFSELKSLQKRAKTTKLLFTEGSTDATVLRSTFRRLGRPDLVTISVDRIDFDETQLQKDEMSSNRLQVVKLARDLEPDAALLYQNTVCLIDADLAHYFKTTPSYTLLMHTDLSDLLIYFFKPEVIERIIDFFPGETEEASKTVGLAESRSSEVYMRFISEAAVQIFAVRVLSHAKSLKLSFKNSPPSDNCEMRGGLPVFNQEAYLRRLLTKVGWPLSLADAVDECQKFRPLTDIDLRCHMRGHDFTDLLKWMLTQRRVLKSRHNENEFEAIVMLCEEAAELQESVIVQNIVQRFAA